MATSKPLGKLVYFPSKLAKAHARVETDSKLAGEFSAKLRISQTRTEAKGSNILCLQSLINNFCCFAKEKILKGRGNDEARLAPDRTFSTKIQLAVNFMLRERVTRRDTEIVLSLALCYVDRMNNKYAVMKKTSIEAAGAAVIFIYLALAYAIDTPQISLMKFHKEIMRDYCSFEQFQIAMSKIFRLENYNLNVQESKLYGMKRYLMQGS